MSHSTTVPPPTEAEIIKTPLQERASDCLLSLFISLCKHWRVSRKYVDARGIFFFHAAVCWNLQREWHPGSALADSRSRTTTTPLMKQHAKETLMLYKWIRLIPAAFPGRPATASPSKLEMAPVHPPPPLKQSTYHVCLFVCLLHKTFVPLAAVRCGGVRTEIRWKTASNPKWLKSL